MTPRDDQDRALGAGVAPDHADPGPSTAHRIPRAGGSLAVRDFPGAGPAFVLLHGFPDDSRIYDYLIPRLVAAGRRVVALDFLGFGASDKPQAGRYGFDQQLGDLEAVVEALALDRIVAVGHDAGGPSAVNFALKHPERAAGVTLINAFYGDAPGLLVPEFIDLFSIGRLEALHRHFLASPQHFAWLLDFQRGRMQAGLTDRQKERYARFLGPVIDANFRQTPSALPAFVGMTSQLNAEISANTARLVELRASRTPFTFIWGRNDPYLHVSVAQYLRSQVAEGALHVLDAGHWPQIDADAEVAELMLA